MAIGKEDQYVVRQAHHPEEDRGADKPNYWRDNALDKLGEEIRMKHHEHLHDAQIVFLMTKKASVKGGRISYGKTKLATGLTKYFARADFVIVITAVLWDKAPPEERRAMVDHELSHCSYEEAEEGNRSWTIRHHDVEEFTAVVDRHGLWQEQLHEFGQAVGRQLELGLNDPFDSAQDGTSSEPQSNSERKSNREQKSNRKSSAKKATA